MKGLVLPMYEAEDVSFLSDQELWDRLAIFDKLSNVDVLNELSKRLYIRDEYKSAMVLLEEAKQLLLELKDLAPVATEAERKAFTNQLRLHMVEVIKKDKEQKNK